MHSEDVVDSTDTKALATEGKICLRVLTQLDAFVHGADDVCLGQELICNTLSGSHCNSKCDVSTVPWKRGLMSERR